jgi:hypothetical protein
MVLQIEACKHHIIITSHANTEHPWVMAMAATCGLGSGLPADGTPGILLPALSAQRLSAHPNDSTSTHGP